MFIVSIANFHDAPEVRALPQVSSLDLCMFPLGPGCNSGAVKVQCISSITVPYNCQTGPYQTLMNGKEIGVWNRFQIRLKSCPKLAVFHTDIVYTVSDLQGGGFTVRHTVCGAIYLYTT